MQNRKAGARVNIVNSCGMVSTCRHEFGSHGVEGDIKYLIVMACECVEGLSRAYVPYFAGPVDGARGCEVSWKLELRWRDFARVFFQNTDALPTLHIPNLKFWFKGYFHTLAVLSKDPVIILVPSAEKFRETISPSWPLKFNLQKDEIYF